MNQYPIYLDHAASSPLLPEALEAMMPFLRENPGNASSQHAFGRMAHEAVEEARSYVASMIGAESDRIFFTSGGTEADNWAVKSVFDVAGTGRRVLYSPTEHAAVLESIEWLEDNGVPCKSLSVDNDGLVSLDDLRLQLDGKPALVAIMHVNNETGVIQPIAQAAEICHESGAVIHVDGVQAARWLDVNVNSLGVNSYAISAHKVGGPKGIGALYIRRGQRIVSFMHGGSQEEGKRGGTINVPGVVGFGCAAQRTVEQRLNLAQQTETLKTRFEELLFAGISDLKVTSAAAPRVPSITHVTVGGIEGESLLIALDFEGIAASAGAACSSGSTKPSHVLLAMGMPVDRARSAVRFSLGPDNSSDQLDWAVIAMERSVAELRSLS